MPDYTALAATARRLVADAGAGVTFVQLEETPTDSDKPWRGNATPRNTANSEVPGDAVTVPPSSASQLGVGTSSSNFVKRADMIMIAVVDAGEPDIENYDEVIDADGRRWLINEVQKLRPATTTLLYFVSVRR